VYLFEIFGSFLANDNELNYIESMKNYPLGGYYCLTGVAGVVSGRGLT